MSKHIGVFPQSENSEAILLSSRHRLSHWLSNNTLKLADFLNNYPLAAPSILLFFIFFLDWCRNPAMSGYGLYAGIDGQWAAWYAKSLFSWSKPLDLNSLNPFQGMVSVFIPNSSWWNPGAWAFLLPLSETAQYIASYSIYWIELFLSLFILSRCVGLGLRSSVLVSQCFVILLFPNLGGFFVPLPQFSLAPANAHWIAGSNLVLVLFYWLGRCSIMRNLLILAGLLLLTLSLIYSGSITLLTYLPVYSVMAIGMTIPNLTKTSLLWKWGGIGLVAILFYWLGIHHYFEYSIGFSSRMAATALETAQHFTVPPDNFWAALKFHLHWIFSWNTWFTWPALLGALWAIKHEDKKFQSLAIALFTCIITLVLLVASDNLGLSSFHEKIRFIFILWPLYPFYCIFFVIFIYFVKQTITERLDHNQLKNFYQKKFVKPLSQPPFSILYILPLAAMFIYSQFPRIAPNFSTDTDIVKFLSGKLAMNPGDIFKGSVVSFFATDPQSLICEKLRLEGKVDCSLPGNMPDRYIESRYYLRRTHGNMHMFSDLWRHNIPTLEEYGQWISAPMYTFFKTLLASPNDGFYANFLQVNKLDIKILRALGVRYIISDRQLNDPALKQVLVQEGKKRREDPKHAIQWQQVEIIKKEVNLFIQSMASNGSHTIERQTFKQHCQAILEKCNSKTKPLNLSNILFGLDMAISLASGKGSKPLNIAQLKEISRYFFGFLHHHEDACPLYLFEIANPNRGTYSPTTIIVANQKEALFRHIQRPDFSFEKTAVLQSPIHVPLTKAYGATLRFEPNQIHLRAKAQGWSLLVIPVQYSHCYQSNLVKPGSSVHPPKILRINGVQTGILFEKDLDTTLSFQFGLKGEMGCRGRDIKEIQDLGLMGHNNISNAVEKSEI